MTVIRKLPPEIIGQIAAGEVVERPASAVKELVENSIDAGARNVTVELREGGIQYLRVSDNGRGIPAEQIRLAFERHATSKLSKPADLYDLHTLGFRGEALASIAAVARVTLTTRTENAPFGTRAVVEAGEFTDIRQAASPVGTTVVVENLFFNTPVRLKFLKKPAAEAALVADYMQRLILSRPDVAFRFASQGKTIYHSMGDGKLESALYCLYGREAFAMMRKVSGHMNGIVLSGYVGTGELSRGNRQQQSFFVNGRFFRSQLISRALEDGCEGQVMVGRFPMCALFLEMPNQQVDVNVHPNKLEVRFQNEPAVSQAVSALVREALHAETLGGRLTAADTQSAPATEKDKADFAVVPLSNPAEIAPAQSEAPVETQAQPASDAALRRALEALKPAVIPAVSGGASLAQNTMAGLGAKALSAIRPTAPAAPPPRKTQDEPQQQTIAPEAPADQGRIRLVGIVFDTYWIFETGDRLLLLDQHAAHERMLYDRLMARFEKGTASQQLLSPQLVRLTAHDMALVTEFAPVLADAGFVVEPFDDACVAVKAIPTLFGENDSPRELLMEALDEWQAGRGQVTRERIRRRVAQMACKHAIKGGDRLNEQQVRGFLCQLLESGAMPTCPHGRPIVTEITLKELEKRFKRIP